jgi:hypothetical protein
VGGRGPAVAGDASGKQPEEDTEPRPERGAWTTTDYARRGRTTSGSARWRRPSSNRSPPTDRQSLGAVSDRKDRAQVGLRAATGDAPRCTAIARVQPGSPSSVGVAKEPAVLQLWNRLLEDSQSWAYRGVAVMGWERPPPSWQWLRDDCSAHRPRL